MTDAADTKSKPIWLRLWPLYLIAGGLVAAWAFGLFDYLSLETLRRQQAALRAFVEDNLILAIAAYIGIYTASTVFMLPGALWITITGGFLFGLAGGTLATVIGATFGASLLFLAAKTSLGGFMRKIASGYAEKVRTEFQNSPMAYMFAMRFIPAMPFPVANILPAILGAKYRDYAITTALGIVPGVVAYTWAGAGLGATFAKGEDPDLASVFQNLLPAAIALGVVSLLPVAWKKFFPKKANQIEEAA